MLGVFSVIKDKFKLKYGSICIDNWVFKLHYRATTTLFLIATILVTSREYIGDHIKCVTDSNMNKFIKVIETYCFVSTTFTVIPTSNYSFENYGILGYLPIVDPHGIKSKLPIRRHSYYQWVPFFLFGQSIMFYLTHILWKNLEGGRVKKLLVGLDNAAYALLDKEVEVNNQRLPTRKNKEKCINRIKNDFLKHVTVNKSWARNLIFCEVLNVLHILLEIFLTDRFLSKEFFFLGKNVTEKGYRVLDEVFPKVTKCTFHKYGPSGTIQNHDNLCILALNIMNEKIYLFFWFWFAALLVTSCSILLWRLFSMLLYSRCIMLNQIIFGAKSRGQLNPWQLKIVAKDFSYADWLLMKYLSKNMDGVVFTELFINLSEDLEERKPLYMFPDEEARAVKKRYKQ